MKKVLYLGFCLVLAMGVGCAITNYSLITDNDQVSNGQGTGVVNTNGKAHIVEGSQIATIWPDGTDELFTMVDQKANGDRTLTTYNNFSTSAFPIFHDDEYCNPDWQGCAIITAPDPEIGDDDIFDPSFDGANDNCFGERSLSLLLSTSRYYGECGRAKIGLADRISLANMGRLTQYDGEEALLYQVNRSNFTVTLDNTSGVSVNIPVKGTTSIHLMDGKMVIDANHPLMAYSLRAVADFVESYGTNLTVTTITYNGISTSFDTSMSAEAFNLKALSL